MNKYENDMVKILIKLKEEHGVVGVKAEFEAEGSRFNELIRLKEIISKANLGLYIKISGCEAVRDILDCEIIGVEGIIAPMIESPFALSKYINMVKNYVPKELIDQINFGITFETKTAQKYIDDIVSSNDFDFLDTFTVGRVDLSRSYGLTRKDINSPKMLEHVGNIFKKIENKKQLIKCIGGGISLEATSFINTMISYGVKRFETRKVIFEINDDLSKIKESLMLAMEFEYLWLKNKKQDYGRMHNEDNQRMGMMEKRLSESDGTHRAW